MVSIIIVNYNGGTALKECVESALLSNHPVEIRVVDNASTDPSLSYDIKFLLCWLV